MADTIPAVPKTDIGHGVGISGATGYPWDQSEWSPELQWPLSIVAFDRMRRQDAQVQSILRAVCLPIRRTQWRIDPNGARDEVVQLIAEDLNLAILGDNQDPSPTGRPRTRRNFSWEEHLRMALLCLSYGHMPFELVCKIDDHAHARLDHLGVRMPATIGRINVDRSGNLVSLDQYPSGIPGDTGGPFDTIPADRLVMYVHEREAGLWQGQSILRSAYKNWFLKDKLLRVDTMRHERTGMGVPVYYGPPNASQAELAQGAQLAQSYRAGESSGAGLPNGSKLELVGVTGSVSDPLASIAYHDTQISHTVLAQFLDLVTTTHGSRALATSMIDFFIMALQATADEIADTASQQIIERLVDYNWGPDEAAPQLVCAEIADQHGITAEAIAALVTSGALEPDPALDAYIRAEYRMPPRDIPWEHATPPLPLPPPEAPKVLASADPKVREAPAATWAGAKNLTRIIDHYAPLLAQASSGLLDPKRVAADWSHTTISAAAPVPDPAAQAAAEAAARAFLARQTPDIQGMLDTLTQLYADAYSSGVQAATTALGQTPDWTVWQPGNSAAAKEVWGTDGGRGLRTLLDDAQVTIRSIADSRFNELADVLGQALNEGWSPKQTATAITGLLEDPSTADMIARTETARGQTVAAVDQYRANGIERQAWLLAAGACPLCEENEAASPIGIDDFWPNGDVPVHPNCVCAIAPVIGGQEEG